MKKIVLVLILLVFIIGCTKEISTEGTKEETKPTVKTEIKVKQMEMEIVVSPSVGNTISNEVVVSVNNVPKEATAVAFALVPAGEQFAPQHLMTWDEQGDDDWSYRFDTSNFDNGDYSLITMPVKQKGEPPLVIATVEVVIKNEKAIFVPPPTNSISYRKSLVLSEYTASTSDINGAKEMGANMITLAFNLDITTDNQVKIPSDPSGNFKNLKKKLSNLINEAHKNGLHVELRTAMVPESEGATDTEKLLENMLPFMREWAKFAEERKVYSFTTFGEVDDSKHSKETDRFNKAVLTEVRKNYKGKIGVGFCCTYSKALNPKGKEYQYDLSGYDYFIISIYPGVGGDELQRYYDMLVPAISGARKMADENGVSKLFVGEAGVLNPGEESPVFTTAVVSPEQEAEFYDQLFTTTNTLVEGYSLAYSFAALGIKGQPAEESVSKWYGSRLQ